MTDEKIQQVTQLLFFLHYLREEYGPNYVMGGHILEEVYDDTFRFCGVSREQFEKAILD
jgi:hypothetical protein